MRILVCALALVLLSPIAGASLNETQKTALLAAIQNGDMEVLNHISVDTDLNNQTASGMVQSAQYRGLFDNGCGENYPGQDYYTGKRKLKTVTPPKRYWY